MSSTARARWARPRRFRPASASSVASISPVSALRSRVSTLPRSSSTLRSGLSRRACACRRSDAAPRRAPWGRAAIELASAGDQRVAHVLAFETGGDRHAFGQQGRQVLGRMHRGVDLAVEQRRVDLLGEQPLAAGFGERPVLDEVAAGADDLRARLRSRPSRAPPRRSPRLVRLSQSQRRAARAEGEKDAGSHARAIKGECARRLGGRRRVASGIENDVAIAGPGVDLLPPGHTRDRILPTARRPASAAP